ncbi:trans-aconitate 2-methyltransferase [Caballeronia ptereochthonis]|uniref:Trans-aconitate 2-methyltransferase n=1 Tax=Caballeronia ptereochthonis TaxID=1777144 RepID=A0A158E8W4_9BURK|nr:trans-aconitate 2-methyltransferase [Caballeronia ptereochthonis]SAL03322.1 trans-aconitate 2-methyltransferase [Caballeronia ptereochthonis]
MTTSSADWQARQYTLFEEERTRPVRDLLNAAQAATARTAVDLGCGPGNSTETLLAYAPDASVLGVDNSGDMIAAARKRLPRIEFELADISAWKAEGPYDLILANASLQWVPDHETLFPGLVAKLAEGGRLAVQMPDNLDEPAHRLMREAAADGPWRDKLKGAERTARYRAEWYYSLLKPQCARVDVWRTTYHHPLEGGIDAIIEWFKGTGLRPFLARLDAQETPAFLERYRAGLKSAYTVLGDGTVLLPFPRIFIVATR